MNAVSAAEESDDEQDISCVRYVQLKPKGKQSDGTDIGQNAPLLFLVNS